MSLSIRVDQPDEVLRFASDELRRFVAKADGWQFVLAVDATMSPFAFAVQVEDRQITFTGHDAACVLHAVYTGLEQAGYVFEITGPRLSHELDLSRVHSLRVQPAVNWRGIRQHINFPMDISSYPLAEALEYIRNLARLRLNHMTFHSYPDQWYAVDLSSGQQLAGNYFYGQRHDIPDVDLIRRTVRNQRVFCIPEHEPYYDDPETNSRLAISWLRALMLEAKRVGLRLQFSFELRDLNLDDSLKAVEAILSTYPMIDVLEIITQESGDWGHAAPASELRQIAAENFGAEVLTDPAIAPHLIDGQKDLDRLMREIGQAIRVFKALRHRDNCPELALGVYCTVRSDHAVLLALMQHYVPENVSFALLLNHGNRAVARDLRDLKMPRRDWDRSMIYSWIEFDGTMYLFQNAVTGIHQLLALATEVYGGAAIHAISFNHWRTAENRTSARYAAQALLRGAVDPRLFYQEYAASLEINDPDRYAAAMALIDDADTQARDQLPNVGFCYASIWGTQGLGYFGVFKKDRLISVRSRYEAALTNLHICANSTINPEGQQYLSFVANRARCTALYLEAVERAVALQPICADTLPEQLTDEERELVRAICDSALVLMEQYMSLHSEAIVDRGCEGTLISFYYTPPAVLKRIRAEYGGSGESLPAFQQTSDAPPSPIWSEE